MNVSGIRNYQQNNQNKSNNPKFSALKVMTLDKPFSFFHTLKFRLSKINFPYSRKFRGGIDSQGRFVSYRFGRDEAAEIYWKDYYEKIQQDAPIREYSVVPRTEALADMNRFNTKFPNGRFM